MCPECLGEGLNPFWVALASAALAEPLLLETVLAEPDHAEPVLFEVALAEAVWKGLLNTTPVIASHVY